MHRPRPAIEGNPGAPDSAPNGAWTFEGQDLARALRAVRSALYVVREATGLLGVGFAPPEPGSRLQLVASLAPLYPEWLGDRSFLSAHGTRFPYVAGAMANGIATTDLVASMARSGMLGFFGAAGLLPERVEGAIVRLKETLDPAGLPWGANLIHSPNEPAIEDAVADLYVRHGVTRVSASAYMRLTPAIVRYTASGLMAAPDGRVRRKNHVFAKVSRPEVAALFLEPAPAEILDSLVARGLLTASESSLARRIPMAEDITAEADSGGHTDNRPLGALLPVISRLRDEIAARQRYDRPVRVGAAGGIGTPSAVASAFAHGAAYVLTGSVNQSAVESGLSDEGRRMLAEADMSDVIMAPAADMFELGVKVQVLKRGTLFGPRALKLYETYRAWPSLEAIPAAIREQLERDVMKDTFEKIWERTREFFVERDPTEVERAERDPKHRMALVFRWYLGLSSGWAIVGEASRRADYQIWCGPAMGAFNDWVRGSFLGEPENRTASQIALNLMEGAAVVTRAQQLRACGVAVPAAAFRFVPRLLA